MKARSTKPVMAVLPQEPSASWRLARNFRALSTAFLVSLSILTLSSTGLGGSAGGCAVVAFGTATRAARTARKDSWNIGVSYFVKQASEPRKVAHRPERITGANRTHLPGAGF